MTSILGIADVLAYRWQALAHIYAGIQSCKLTTLSPFDF